MSNLLTVISDLLILNRSKDGSLYLDPEKTAALIKWVKFAEKTHDDFLKIGISLEDLNKKIGEIS